MPDDQANKLTTPAAPAAGAARPRPAPATTPAPPPAQAASASQTLTAADLEAVLRAAGVDPATAAVSGTDSEAPEVAPGPSIGAGSIDLLRDVALDVRIELGRTRMYLADVLRLGSGSVVSLDKLAGDPVEVLVNGQLVARGEVMVLDDNFCVRITEIIGQSETKANS